MVEGKFSNSWPATDRADGRAEEQSATVTDRITDLLLPHSLSGVFDEAFDLYKRHFKTLALLVALLFFPTQIALHAASNIWLRPIEAHLNAENGMPDTGALLSVLFGGLLVGAPEYGIPGLLALAVLILTSGPVCILLTDIYLGRPTSIRSAYRRALPFLFRLLAAWIVGLLAFVAVSIVLFFAVVFLAGMVAIAVGGELGPMPSSILFIVGTFLDYILCMGLVARYYLFTSQLVVLEGLPLSGIWDRNWQIVSRSRFRRTWLASITLPIVVFGLQYLILFSVNQAVGLLHLAAMPEFMLATALTACVVLFFQPYPVVLTTLLYYDYRMRREGVDIRVMWDGLRRADRAWSDNTPQLAEFTSPNGPMLQRHSPSEAGRP